MMIYYPHMTFLAACKYMLEYSLRINEHLIVVSDHSHHADKTLESNVFSKRTSFFRNRAMT